MVNTIEFSQFLDVDIRVGTIIKAEINVSLKKPSIVLLIDFGNDKAPPEACSSYDNKGI